MSIPNIGTLISSFKVNSKTLNRNTMSYDIKPRLIKIDERSAKQFWSRVEQERRERTEILDNESDDPPIPWVDKEMYTTCPCCFGNGVVPFPKPKEVPAMLTFVIPKDNSLEAPATSSKQGGENLPGPKLGDEHVEPRNKARMSSTRIHNKLIKSLHHQVATLVADLKEEKSLHATAVAKNKENRHPSRYTTADRDERAEVEELYAELEEQKARNEKLVDMLQRTQRRYDELAEASDSMRLDITTTMDALVDDFNRSMGHH